MCFVVPLLKSCFFFFGQPNPLAVNLFTWNPPLDFPFNFILMLVKGHMTSNQMKYIIILESVLICFYLNICPSSRNMRHTLFIWHNFVKSIIKFVQPTQGTQTLRKIHTWVQSLQEPTNTTSFNTNTIFNFKSSNPWAFDMSDPILVEYLWNLYRKEQNQVW